MHGGTWVVGWVDGMQAHLQQGLLWAQELSGRVACPQQLWTVRALSASADLVLTCRLGIVVTLFLSLTAIQYVINTGASGGAWDAHSAQQQQQH